ncbi:MAG: glycosyltransferase family 39 protein [Pseudomonadota bacterium]|nr:MAG: glycosyltransferase family 39 protein [Pseudomonadota bacterium]
MAALLALATFLLLLILRGADDNRLVSWQWTFANADIAALIAMFAVALAAAYVVLRAAHVVEVGPALLFTLAFAAGALCWREPEVIVDAARYLAQAKQLQVYGIGYFLSEWGHGIWAWTDLPLVPFIYGLALELGGGERIAIQFVVTAMFAGTVVLTYYIGGLLWNAQVGRSAGALLLGMPYLLTQVPLSLVDVPTMFFLTLAVYLSLRALREGGTTRVALAGAAIVLALLAKYSTWLMLTVLPVMAVVCALEAPRIVARRTAALCTWVVLLSIPLLMWRAELFAVQLQLLMDYQLAGLQRWHETMVSTLLFQVHPWITLFALVAVALALWRRDARFLIVTWMLLLIVMLEIKRSRYMLVAFPMLALMAGYGLTVIRNQTLRGYVVMCVVSASLLTAMIGYLPFLRSTSAANLQAAGSYLDAGTAPTAEVIVLPQRHSVVNPVVAVPILDLYTRKSLVFERDAELHGAPPSDLATSALRFTWEYRDPAYLRAPPGPSHAHIPVVVILDAPDQALPPRVAQKVADLNLAREFNNSSEIFRFRTVVRVYEPRQGPGSAGLSGTSEKG